MDYIITSYKVSQLKDSLFLFPFRKSGHLPRKFAAELIIITIN